MSKMKKLILGIILGVIIVTLSTLGILIQKGILKIRALPETYFVVYTKPLFETILPTTSPQDSDKIQTLEIKVTPGEFEPASFAIWAKTKLENFQVSLNDATDSSGNKISKENLSAWVVYVWEQSPGWRWSTGNSKVLTPELLVKDEAQVTASLPGNWTTPNNLPNWTMTGDPKTTINQNQSKQFWIIVKVPDGATPGDYQGRITLSGSNMPVIDVPLNIKVLPFKLVDSSQINKILGIYFASTYLTDPTTGQPRPSTVSRELFLKQLRDLKEHGLNSVMVNMWIADTDDKARETLNYIKEAGFVNPKNNTIVLSGWGQSLPWPQRPEIPRNIQIAQQLGFDAYYLTGDEPSTENQEKLEIYCERAKLVSDYGVKNTVPIWKEMADFFENPFIFPKCGKWTQEPVTYTLPVNMPIYAIVDPTNHPTIFNYIRGLQSGTITKNPKTELYYWPLWVPQKMLANRLLSSFFLAYSGLDGVYPFTYQDLSHAGNLYNDFDIQAGQQYTYPYYGVTYPLQNDILSTLNWEAVREGIDDLRYLETLKLKITEAKVQHPDFINQINQIENELQTKVEQYKNITSNPQISAKDVADARIFIQDKIVQVMNIANVGGGNETNANQSNQPSGTNQTSGQNNNIFNYPSVGTGPALWLIILLAAAITLIIWLSFKIGKKKK